MTLRKNSLFISIGGGIRLAVNLAAIPLLVRFLGIDSYGIWTTINAMLGLLTLAEMGVSTAMLYHLPDELAQEDEQVIQRLLGSSLALLTAFSLIITILYYICVPVIGKTFHQFAMDEVLLTSLKISTMIIFPRILTMFFASILASYQRYDLQALIETTTTVLLQAGIILLAWQKTELPLLIGWMFTCTLLGIIAYILVGNKILKVNFSKMRFARSEAKNLLSYGVQHWVSSLGSSLFGQMDRILVNAFLGPATAGVYSAATSLTTKINELSAIPIKVITPAISTAKSKEKYSEIRQIFIKATKINGLVALLVALPLIFWADVIGQIVMSGKTAIAFTRILPILAGIYSIYSLAAAGFYLSLGMGKPKINAVYGIIGGLLLCVAIPLLTAQFGIIGAVIANAFYIIVLAINFHGARMAKINLVNYALELLRSVGVIIAWTVVCQILPITRITIGFRIGIFIIAGVISLAFVAGQSLVADLTRYLRQMLHLQGITK